MNFFIKKQCERSRFKMSENEKQGGLIKVQSTG
jgi:hypothetical protein